MRLKDYDYSSRGLYFVTLCTQFRTQFLGTVENKRSIPSRAGRAVYETWLELPKRFPSVELDVFVVMPNHLHGVLAFVGTGLPAGGHFVRGAASGAPTLGKVMRAFKSLSAIKVNRILDREGVAVWQRNYFEHIVRNGEELKRIEQYIFENPVRWEFDPENPQSEKPDFRMPWEQSQKQQMRRPEGRSKQRPYRKA